MKKNKRGVAIAASSVLAMSLFTFSASMHTSASTPTVSKSYLIAYGQSLPKNYQTEIKNAGGEVVRAMPEIGGVEVKSTNPNFLNQLKSSSKIVGANMEKVHKLTDGTPEAADGKPVTLTEDKDGTYWSAQWDIQRLTNEGKTYNIESGGTKAGDKVVHKAVVGIIDSGIDAGHPDLQANFIGGKNFVPKEGYSHPESGIDPAAVTDTNGHGTHVAGSIAGNGKIKGVGPDLGIKAYRIFDASGSAPTAPIVEAIIQAAKDGVDVINMSIGGFDNLRYYYDGTRYTDVADVVLWKRAVQYAVNKNVTVVASAGNDSLNYADKKALTEYVNEAYGDENLVYKGVSIDIPGGTPGVITVASSNKWSQNKLAFYSNYGNGFIDVAAPGGDNGPKYDNTRVLSDRDFTYRALSTYPTYLTPYVTTTNTGYAYMHGTSMAAPKVAGIAGVIKAAHPEYTPAQVNAVIEQTALDYGKKGHDELYGSGEANAYSALTGK